MLPPVPVLADYGLSPRHGFLPETLPLTHLPDPYYNKWEAIAANLQALVLTRRLRSVVDRLPVLSSIGLEHEAEWRRAYSLLCFMAHAYIWGGDAPADRLPKAISVPLLEISDHLEVPPVATYAAVCLWNFKPVFVDEEIDSLENLATLNTFTGSIDESWFYLVSVAIEARGAPILDLMLTAIGAARRNDAKTVTRCLVSFAERLTDLTNILVRMPESCDPTVFYHRVRPFLAGSKNMAEAGLPHGVLYDQGTGTEKYRQYSGGSNAQSSLIQFFDIVLGIHHLPTGERHKTASSSSSSAAPEPEPEPEPEPDPDAPRNRNRNNFIQEMRRYMPGPHARFLADVSRVANVRQFVQDNRSNRQLCLAYDACLAMLSAFRDKHIAIVTRYIITPSREARTGTGGTALIPFLKQARDETGEPAVEEWTRRFMRARLKAEHQADPVFSGADRGAVETDVDVKGLAGTWTMDDEGGGICSF
ncbi:Indoleamine 2,3-dioxygenase subfamily [Metarhizium album ARSEF 1941]|uniref:Indoleamine 2,3-dioxygenase subfamily n=1 Tax=Metarhizium album (strain ARSEF 1941) TaxID=1081103 RepID=A0A0B2WNW2_METAS|nr:Indoleamine 2,3-dioxygenase subfamily [Metarhizium album ARSEF 1941]KHN95177.1 Indoleamine 2,3-dioxygenase subfamily [Metarhizium album ARSEF 1941]